MDLPREILKDVGLEEIRPKRVRDSSVDHWPQPVLLERAAYLRKLAKLGNGSASETLRAYPQHEAILSFRARSGETEVYPEFACVYLVLAGAATLVAGEARQELRQGDIAHVPAGMPHQMLVAHEKPVTCFVLKTRAEA